MTGRQASLKLEHHLSEPFTILNSTPQGSPLSPILLVLYMALLLELARHWKHRDLTLYVNDSAIFSTSATITTATKTAIKGFEIALDWLQHNRLLADPAKTKLIVFSKPHQPHLTRNKIWGAQYRDNNHTHNITSITSLCYLGVFITNNLKWAKHVSIMVNHTCSTIRGISILGNSIWGLDFINWRCIYNALVIPILTYGT